jgi:pimeloyl-ACP methyl ester carboxylesterase
MNELPGSFRTVALTLRGHGDSSKALGGYGTKAFATDVILAMEKLGIIEAAIVGHSLGSLVAQRIALEAPRRVSSLILIGAFATLKGNPAAEALWRDEVAGLRDPVDPDFVRAFQQSSLAAPVAADFFEGVVAESLKLLAHVWRSTLRALLDEDHSSRLHEISAPTLLVWGDRDAFTGHPEQQLLAREIRCARLIIQAGIGHAPHWEDPKRCATELTAFIDAQRRKPA